MSKQSMAIFDIETDSLDPTVVYIITVFDMQSEQIMTFLNPLEGLNKLNSYDILIGHNVVNFDLPVLAKLYQFKPREDVQVWDTLIMSRLLFGDLYNFEERFYPQWKLKLPPRLRGSHSLEAWGLRLGELKDTWGEQRTDWVMTSENQEEFLNYARQDTRVTKVLFDFLYPLIQNVWEPFLMETEVAKIIQRQMAYGFAFDIEAAKELLGSYYKEMADIEKELQKAFPPWEEQVGVYKRANKAKGINAGDPKIVKVKFNPGSRKHIALKLQEKYSWTPQKFTELGNPIINDEILNSLDYPEAKLLSRYLNLQKLAGLLAEGNQGVLKHIKADGRVHGTVNTLGAVSRRMTHSSPNVAQMPTDSEFRKLFIAPNDNCCLVGIDASGLELRCLAHYLARNDNGVYAHQILQGDIHTYNQQAAGLKTRAQAKRFIYAFLYGAGTSLLAQIAEIPESKGAKLKQKFLNNIQGLPALIEDVQNKAKGSFIKSLDGVPLFVRDSYKALNLLLQSAGAIVMKRALVILDNSLQSKGLIPGQDYEFVANIHDEWQIQAKKELANIIAEEGVKAIKAAGRFYNFRCPLDGEAKIGMNWAETH